MRVSRTASSRETPRRSRAPTRNVPKVGTSVSVFGRGSGSVFKGIALAIFSLKACALPASTAPIGRDSIDALRTNQDYISWPFMLLYATSGRDSSICERVFCQGSFLALASDQDGTRRQ